METDIISQKQVEETTERVLALLADLPPQSLPVVERFVQFLQEQAENGQPLVLSPVKEERPPYKYPTVPVPALSLSSWLNLVPEGYEGDALADTEALYDEA
jgi:hypothetical protein